MKYNADLKSQKINYRKSKKSFDKLFTTFFAEPKVGYLYKAVFVKQQVVQFEIPKDKKKIKKQSRLLGMNDKTIQRLTDIQFYGREETVNPRPHRRSRTCWVTRVWWGGGGGGRGQGEGGGGQRNSTHIRKPC